MSNLIGVVVVDYVGGTPCIVAARAWSYNADAGEICVTLA